MGCLIKEGKNIPKHPKTVTKSWDLSAYRPRSDEGDRPLASLAVLTSGVNIYAGKGNLPAFFKRGKGTSVRCMVRRFMEGWM